MTVFSWGEIRDMERPLFSGTALTIGGFDGPHRGHDALFRSVLAQEGLVPGIITFSRSPRAFPELKSGSGRKALPGTELSGEFGGDVSTLMLRLESFRQRGFAFAVVIDFSEEFSKLNGEIFLNMLEYICAMRYIAVGPDFRCGYRLDTGPQELLAFAEAYNVRADILDACLVDGKRVSSSSIREAVLKGDLRQAEKLLGNPFRLDCSVFVPSDTPGTAVAEKRFLTQVVPPDGEYPVIAVGEDGSRGKGLLRISDGRLALVSELRQIRMAEFIWTEI